MLLHSNEVIGLASLIFRPRDDRIGSAAQVLDQADFEAPDILCALAVVADDAHVRHVARVEDILLKDDLRVALGRRASKEAASDGALERELQVLGLTRDGGREHQESAPSPHLALHGGIQVSEELRPVVDSRWLFELALHAVLNVEERAVFTVASLEGGWKPLWQPDREGERVMARVHDLVVSRQFVDGVLQKENVLLAIFIGGLLFLA